MGVNQIKFSRIVPAGKAKGMQKVLLEQDDVKFVFSEIDKVRKIYDKDSLNIKLSGVFGPKPGSKGEELSKKNEYCPAGKSFFSIETNNEIYPCPFLTDNSFLIGKYEGHFPIKSSELFSYRRSCVACHIGGEYERKYIQTTPIIK